DDSADNTSHTIGLGSDPGFGYLVTGLLPPNNSGPGRIGLQLDPATPVSILAGAGNDLFQVRNFAGVPGLKLDGGGGVNMLDYSAYVGNIDVDLARHFATGFAGGIYDIANVTGSIGNDLIVGDANANFLRGGTGRNIIIGGAGTDQLIGSAGSDNLLI